MTTGPAVAQVPTLVRHSRHQGMNVTLTPNSGRTPVGQLVFTQPLLFCVVTLVDLISVASGQHYPVYRAAVLNGSGGAVFSLAHLPGAEPMRSELSLSIEGTTLNAEVGPDPVHVAMKFEFEVDVFHG
jgi:hypothetical protein